MSAGYSWGTVEWALRTAAEPWAERVARRSEDQLSEVREARAAEPVDPFMPDAMVRALAERRADLMIDTIARLDEPMTPERMRAWLSERVQALEAKPLPDFSDKRPVADQLAGMLARVRCPLWWRRQLRRVVVVKREVLAIERGEVSKRRRQVYVTHDTVQRRALRNASNAAMLERTEIECEHGEVITLAQAVAASTANKAIRRGELMTRIRGCEEWAVEAGMVGIFTTNTTPSRFHPQSIEHGRNPNYDGSTPSEAQLWLRRTWAATRSALRHAGVRFFGFRVAEPHHDGCPHWHMLLWAAPEHIESLRSTMRKHWLKDAGDERGAAEHRFKAETISAAKGGAVAYVSKYISKNIDDVGALAAEGHRDERAGEQAELFGATASRVEAWAGAWGIRQFQAIGQPPVTVWRELRRIEPEAVAGATKAVRDAHEAVHRHGERRADWRAYLAAQGGAMVGRDYRVRVVCEVVEREGRYGTAEVPVPIGVEDAKRPGEVVLSSRRAWKARGSWSEGERRALRDNPLREVVWGEAPQAHRPPRTRFNNCARGHGARDLLAELNGRSANPFSSNGGVHDRGNPDDPPPTRGWRAAKGGQSGRQQSPPAQTCP